MYLVALGIAAILAGFALLKYLFEMWDRLPAEYRPPASFLSLLVAQLGRAAVVARRFVRAPLPVGLMVIACWASFLLAPGTAFADTAAAAPSGPFGLGGTAGGIVSILLGLVLGQHLIAKAWNWVVSKFKPANVSISTNHTVNDIIDAFLNAGEGVLTHTITGEKLEQLLQLVASGAGGPAIVSFLSTNFGTTLVDQVKAAIGPLATEEAAVLFGNRGAVEHQIQLALARVAPQVAQAKSASQLSAAQVASSLAALSSPKAVPSQPPANT